MKFYRKAAIKKSLKMFEARLVSSGTFKKVLDSIKDLLNEATFDCSDAGIQVRKSLDVCCCCNF